MNYKDYDGCISDSFLKLIEESFTKYKAHKRSFDERIIENNKWFKNRHLSSVTDDDIPMPSTSYVFNVLANKHAEAMDGYPEPNILERSEKGRKLAEIMTKIIPMQLNLCDFKRTYSRAWWYKLKNGASCYGVFYNPKLRNGSGDICINKIDILNLFWEPGIVDIQDSKFVFLTALVDNDTLKAEYPQYADEISGMNMFDVMTYDDGQNTSQSDIYENKSLVIDCYYKKIRGNKKTVELIKLCNGKILAASEDSGENGIYDHGMYPFVLDVMYPDEDSPVGFGILDVIKSPQLYIDRLDALISRNALISGKSRFLIKDNGGINENELMDISRDVIHVAGSVNEDNIREFQTKPIQPYIINHRQSKINELKEIAGNRDFQQGGTSNGVTAYSAIAALQQAGEKLSRDLIQESYMVYKDIIYMCIELIKQFFTKERSYRVGEGELKEYVNISREMFSGCESSEFDIEISPQKSNPYSRAVQNQTVMDLWKIGVFNPQNKAAAIAMLNCMQIDGRERIIEMINKEAQNTNAENYTAD